MPKKTLFASNLHQIFNQQFRNCHETETVWPTIQIWKRIPKKHPAASYVYVCFLLANFDQLSKHPKNSQNQDFDFRSK